MTNQKNKEQILFSLRNITEEFEKNTKKYLQSFDMNSEFTFSDNEELRKKHLRTYNKFSLILKSHIEEYEKEIAILSTLLCNADTACDKELTETLVNSFNRYALFSESVSRFIKNCNKTFSNKENKFSPIVVVTYAKELLIAAQNYKNNI